jgi:hypothetical protein
MTRGWEAMRGAFVASWRHCADPAAIDGAVRNLSRVLLDDPEVLAASVEAAQRLGDAATLKKRTARLERATRLAPLVARLAGDRADRAAALAELGCPRRRSSTSTPRSSPHRGGSIPRSPSRRCSRSRTIRGCPTPRWSPGSARCAATASTTSSRRGGPGSPRATAR